MFAGLCAFPLTPIAQAGVDSIGALGSTGNYAYLRREERSRVARLAVEAADGTPVMVGVGAVRTRHVLLPVRTGPCAGFHRALEPSAAWSEIRYDTYRIVSVQPPARTTKQQRVHKTLRERIISGAYGPGFRLVIDALAAELGVSAVPVREALRRLEAEGLVIYRPNVGAQVAPAEPGLFVEELLVLAVLDGYATALAAPLLDEADVVRLRETTDLMESAVQRMDPLAFGRHNDDFHAVFADRCPNPALVQMLRDAEPRLDAIRRTVFTHIPYRGAESIAEHRELIELVERGARADRLERAARAHKLRTVESVRVWQHEHRAQVTSTR